MSHDRNCPFSFKFASKPRFRFTIYVDKGNELQTALPKKLKERLLFNNRWRCCVCRNPALPVEIYAIEGNKSDKVLNNFIVLCAGCHESAVTTRQEKGSEYARKELNRYKREWELAIEVWRIEEDYRIIVKGGNTPVHHSDDDEVVVQTWYKQSSGELFEITLKSDELVSLMVMNLDWYGDVGNKVYAQYDPDYEFNVTFTAPKDGSYALVVQRESTEKTTIELESSAPYPDPVDEISQPVEATWKQSEEFDPEAKSEQEVKPPIEKRTEYISWRILPPGEHPFPHILEHFDSLKRSGNGLRHVKERLELINSLEPTSTYIGIDEFRRYVIFYFSDPGIAVLDSPVIGNAIYVIKGDWKTLSGLSKAELLRGHSDVVTRIVHKGDWLQRLTRLIDTPTK